MQSLGALFKCTQLVACGKSQYNGARAGFNERLETIDYFLP